MSDKTAVTTEAHGLIRGERAKTYGPPHYNFEVIADLWNGYITARIRKLQRKDLSQTGQVPRYGFLDGNDVANLMSLLKVAREATGQGYHRDSTVDIIGYQAIKELLADVDPEEFVKVLSEEQPAEERVVYDPNV